VGLYARHLRPRLLEATLADSHTGPIRRRVCTGLFGDVLEIGFGSGLNLPYLPAQVRCVSAVEPSEVALCRSAGRRAASAVPVTVVGDDAQALTLPDRSVDAALSTWNLCGIDDPAAVLREIRRVLRPGGVLHFVEHGLAPDPSVARWQRRGNRLNSWVAGCLLDRDVPALLDGSGLTVTALETYYEPSSPKPAGFFYEGRAVA
jgi:SAM-dependent methyltransferase